MDALLTMSPVVATPLVLEFFLSLLPASTQQSLADNWKRIISLGVGVILTFLATYVQGPIPTDTRSIVLLIVAGLVNGAMGTGAVSLLYGAARKARSSITVDSDEPVKVSVKNEGN